MYRSDGSVVIDTRIDTSGITTGVVDVEHTIDHLSDSSKKLGEIMTSALAPDKFNISGASSLLTAEEQKIQQILNSAEASVRSKAASIAAIYRKQGLSQQEAFKKAWEHIERDSRVGSNKVKSAIEEIGDGAQETGKTIRSSLDNGISSAVRKIAALVGSVFAVGKLVSFGKEAVELGSDLAEVQNVVDVTFEYLNEEVNEFAENAVQQFGLSEKSAKQYASTMGAMLKSMGFSVDAAKDMSLELTGLAGDLASFYNLSSDEAFQKIRAGISGETEPLKQLGINLSVANLEQYALTKGIKKSYNAMSQQEQALLRYNYLLSVTRDAQGDFARTSDSWANQTRILSEQFKSLKATLGQGLINVLTPVAKLLGTIVERLQRAASAFKAFTEVITGADQKAATDTNGAIAESYESVADATEDAENAQKRYLSGLDEIKTFGAGNVDVSEPNAGTTPATQDVTESSSGADKLVQRIDKLKEALTDLWDIAKKGFGDSYIADVQELKENVEELQESNRRVWSNPKLNAAIEDMKKRAIRAIGSITGGLSSLKTSLSIGISGGVSDALKDLEGFNVRKLTSIADNLKLIWDDVDGLGNAIGRIGKAFEGEGFKNLSSIYTKLADITVLDAIEKFTGLLSDLWNFNVKPITDNAEKIEKFLDNVFKFFSLVFKPADKLLDLISDNSTDYKDTWFHKFITSYTDFNSSNFGSALDKANNFFDIVNTRLENAYSSLGEWYNDVGRQIVSNVANGIATKKNELINKATELRDQIKSIFSSMPDWFRDKFADAWQRVKDVFSPGKNGTVFNGIKDGILESLKAIVNKLIEGINQVVSTPFDGLNKAFSTLRDKSIAGIKPFGFLPTISVPQIPYLAKGAVIPPNAPFAAVLGDQRRGTNIEAPLATIEEAVERVFARHADESGGENVYRFTAQIGRRVVFDEVIAEAKLRQSATGRNPFALK